MLLVSQAVGDVQATLLAVFYPIKLRIYFDPEKKRYQNDRYVKVGKNYFDTINLNNRDDIWVAISDFRLEMCL